MRKCLKDAEFVDDSWWLQLVHLSLFLDIVYMILSFWIHKWNVVLPYESQTLESYPLLSHYI